MQPETFQHISAVKIVAIIICCGIIPALAFYIGTQYQISTQEINGEIPPVYKEIIQES